MGGTLTLLAVDVRQTLPVIPRSMPADELNACSYLWNTVEKTTLTTNMRVHLLQDSSAQTFLQQLLDIGYDRAPKNDDVNKLNEEIQSKLPGEIINYKSIDTVMDKEQSVNYLVEFLNSMEPPGITPHILLLKIGSPLMLIRNLNAPK